MKLNTRIIAIVAIVILTSYVQKSNAQSVLDPSDVVQNYNWYAPPSHPPYGEIGKWVRTPRVWFNTDGFKAYIYKGYAFRLKFPKTYVPSVNDGKKYPMLMFFHGIGETGPITDNEFHIMFGGQFFDQSVNNGNFDGYILAMQSTGFFGPNHFQALIEVIQYMVVNNKLDQFQVSANGLSMGGQASWEFMIHHPSYISSALPMSWTSILYTYPNVLNTVKFTPIWHFQGGTDGNPAPYTTSVVQTALLDEGSNFKNTIFPYVHHDTWNYAWSEPDFFPYIKRAYISNPWPLFGKREFYQGEPVNTIIGVPSGFTTYEWRRNGVVISGANSHTITATQLGRYETRVQRNGAWSDWSRTPLDLILKPSPSFPVRIEAENWSAMTGVQTESTLDASGGLNVAYIDNGDWMDYSVVPPNAQAYTLKFRIASPSGGQLQLRKSDGTVLATVSVPNTGGWQTWQTVNITVNLASNFQTLRVVSTGGAWNFNWLELSQDGTSNILPVANAGADQTITLPNSSLQLNGSGTDADGNVTGYSWSKVSGPASGSFNNNYIGNPTINNLVEGSYIFRLSVTDNAGAIASDDVAITVNSAPLPASYENIPSRVQAESYASMSGVQTEATNDAGGGQNLGYIDNGDWMDYNVNVPSAENYNLNIRIAAQSSGGQLQVRKSDGSVLATVNIPQTGGWQTWQGVSANFNLAAGNQTLRIISTSNTGWNFNWLDFTVVPAPAPLPSGRIEAEHYTSMSGVQTEPTSDAGGGLNVGYIGQGDWMNYTVTASAAGSYTMNFRVASMSSGGQLQVRKTDGTVLATLNVPQTGSWQTWQTISAIIPLVQGGQTLRVFCTSTAGWNFNWMEVLTTAPPAASTKIEAEDYIEKSGVQTEPTTDAGGGLNVGYIDQGDWMEYEVNISSAGSYTISFRVASQSLGGKMDIQKGDGSSLATVDLPQTGGWQKWQTVSTTVNLAQGLQTLRVVSTGTANWNFNWMEIAGRTTARQFITSSDQRSSNQEIIERGKAFHVYPNPVNDQFTLRLNNEHTGIVKVEIINMTGSVIKSFSFTKTSHESQVKLSLAGVPRGSYILRAHMNKWKEIQKISKL